MSLKQQIKSDVVVAMKAKDQLTSTVLRGVMASVQAKQTEKRYKISKDDPAKTEEALLAESELGDDEIISVLSSEIKKRRDAIALYLQGGRPELAESEKNEIAILQKYLPEQLSVEEIKVLVTEAIDKVMKDPTSPAGSAGQSMGKVMAELNPKIKGKADGKVVSEMVKELLK